MFIILMAIAEQAGASAKAIGIMFVAFTVAIYALIGYLSRTVQVDAYYLAGRQVQSTMELQYGLRREIAYNAPTYNPVSITFLCTENMDEKRILDKWNNMCVAANSNFDVVDFPLVPVIAMFLLLEKFI